MAYTRLQNKTKGVASEVQANFEYIGSGNLLPKGGNNLDYTTGVYDLGSDSYKWNNLYCNSIINEYNEGIHQFKNIVNYTLASSTSRIEFTGLNGDTDIIYDITGLFNIPSTVGNAIIDLHCNGDSGSNYGYEWIDILSGVQTAYIHNSYTSFLFFYGDSNRGYVNSVIYAKTGYERTSIIKTMRVNSGIWVDRHSYRGAIWNNTSSTITSFVFLMNRSFNVNTNIIINARR